MKKILGLAILTVLTFACGGGTAPNTAKPEAPLTNAPPVQKEADSLTVSSHSQPGSDTAKPEAAPESSAPGTKSKWTQSGDPIDTASFDANIATAEKAFNAKKSDEAAKKSLAEAYLKRAVALTDARQYASALGDYRRALKYDAANEEAKKWITQIVEIYDSINKQYPPEGEEPPPLPFEKKS